MNAKQRRTLKRIPKRKAYKDRLASEQAAKP